MTLNEFIDEYSWEQAREWHAEMLAQNSRRPKQWTFQEKDGTKHTIFFDGCPFRLKSPKMADWLRAMILSAEAMEDESSHGFTAEEQVIICYVAVVTQLEGNLWVFEPQGLPQMLCQAVVKAKAYEDGIELSASLKNIYDNKLDSEELPDNIFWRCVQASLLLSIYLIELSLITGNISSNTFEALNQLKVQLDGVITDAEEYDDTPDFSVEAEYFERLTKLIPKIEQSGNEQLINMAYEFARDYYQATRRFTLAEKFNAKLNNPDN